MYTIYSVIISQNQDFLNSFKQEFTPVKQGKDTKW